MIDIDIFRDKKMKEFEISASTLKNMSSTKLNNKILDVQVAIKQLTIDLRDLKHHIDEGGKFFNHTQKDIQEKMQNKDAEYRALWSILAHLFFKQESEKQPMFIDEELKWAQERVELEKQAKKIVSPLIVDEKLVQKQEELSAQKRKELKELLVKKHTMTKFFEPGSDEAKVASQESKSFEPYIEKPVQKSWWGNVKSWLGW